jgi:hypothetical protein
MRTFTFEVFSDSRPIRTDEQVINASNFGVAARHAYKLAKPFIRRGSRQLTIRLTALKNISSIKSLRDES